jgi:CBS domain-containing protein
MALLAKDVMQAKVVTVESTLSAVELARVLDRERISGAPVVDNGRLTGVVSRADLSGALTEAEDRAEATLDYYRDVAGASPGWSERRLAGERTESLRVKDIMSKALVTVAPTQSLQEVAGALVKHRIHRALVADHDQRLLGVISSLDMVRLVAEGRLVEGRD